MKKLYLNDRTLTVLLLLFCFSFSFKNNINNIFYFVLAIGSFSRFSIKDFKQKFFKNNINRLFILYYSVLVVSLLYTLNLSYGITLLVKMSPMVILPVVIFNIRDLFNKKLTNKCLKYFSYGVLASSFIFLLNSAYNTYIWGAFNPLNEINGNFFSYFNLLSVFKLHPLYYGNNVLLSLCYFSYTLIINNYKSTLSIIAIPYLIVIIFLLNSFFLTGVFIFFLIIFISYLLLKSKLKYFFIFIALLSFPIYKATSFIQEKYKGINILADLTTKDYSGNSFTSVKARNAKANLSIKLIKEHPVLGVGLGDAKEELLKTYLNNGFKHGYESMYNSHNQYLTSYLQGGFLAFFTLLSIIICSFYIGYKQKRFYLLCFTIIISTFMIIESNLERQFGIMFFTFFTLILTVNYKQHET